MLFGSPWPPLFCSEQKALIHAVSIGAEKANTLQQSLKINVTTFMPPTFHAYIQCFVSATGTITRFTFALN